MEDLHARPLRQDISWRRRIQCVQCIQQVSILKYHQHVQYKSTYMYQHTHHIHKCAYNARIYTMYLVYA